MKVSAIFLIVVFGTASSAWGQGGHQGWQADWEKSKAERELAEENRERGEYLEAFRGYCRAMIILMNAVQQQRAKEEMFKPLWDTPERRAE